VTAGSINLQLTQTLSSLNTKLVDMFSSVGNTFASHPPPQSVTAFKDTVSEIGDMLGEWLSNTGSRDGDSSDNYYSGSSRSSSGRSWSGGGSRSGGSSGGGGGGFG
jgi:hypothetical protein